METKLAEQGRAPVHGNTYLVDRVIDVRRAGSGLQVLLRWRGQHDDTWRPVGKCTPAVKREAERGGAREVQVGGAETCGRGG